MTITRDSPGDNHRRRGTRRTFSLMLALSLLAHAALFSIAGPSLLPSPDSTEVGTPAPSDESLVIDATFEEPEDEREQHPEELEQAEPELAELVEEVPEPLEEEEEDEEPEPFEDIEIDRKVVQQETNEDVPEEADYLSDQANRVVEETRAREVTTENVEPSREKTEEGGEPLPEIAARQELPEQQPTPRPRPDSAEQTEQEEVSEVDPEEFEGRDPVIVKRRRKEARRLLMPDVSNYEAIFAERDEVVREQSEAHGDSQKKKLFENWEENDERVRASLQNFIHEVRPGNHTGVNAHRSVVASYVGGIHRKIHVRWANDYLMALDLREPPGSPLNDPNLNAKLEFVIRADDGELEAVNIVNSSGELRFDSEALSTSYAAGPHPNPPPELVSPNGKVYVHWNFWRDQRQCGTFGASVFIVHEDHPSPG